MLPAALSFLLNSKQGLDDCDCLSSGCAVTRYRLLCRQPWRWSPTVVEAKAKPGQTKEVGSRSSLL